MLPTIRTPIRLLAAVLLVVSSRLSAQTSRDSISAGPAFMSIRYASGSAYNVYGGYRLGPALAFVGLVNNPRTQYREALIGLGHTFETPGGNAALVGIAYADASDDSYAQIYLLPTLEMRALTFTGTFEGYVPLGKRGTMQLDVTPAYLHVALRPNVGAGVTYVAAFAADVEQAHAMGPSLRFGIPRGTLIVDLLHAVRRATDEVRVTVQLRF